jgi:TRAP-type C4-dicarboxylate transport system permease small subunit
VYRGGGIRGQECILVNLLEKIDRVINRVLIIVAGIAVVLLMLLGTVSVSMSIFLGHPLLGSDELSGFLGAIVIAFALGETQRRKEHVMVDILAEKFHHRVKPVIDGIKYFLTTVFFGIVSWRVFAFGLMKRASGELSGTLQIIFYPFCFLVALGFAMLTFTLLVDFIGIFAGRREEAGP